MTPIVRKQRDGYWGQVALSTDHGNGFPTFRKLFLPS